MSFKSLGTYVVVHDKRGEVGRRDTLAAAKTLAEESHGKSIKWKKWNGNYYSDAGFDIRLERT